MSSLRAVVYSLVAPAEAVAAGGEVALHLLVLNPEQSDVRLSLAERIEGTLLSETGRWRVSLRGPALRRHLEIKAGGFAVREYVLKLPAAAADFLVLEIREPTVARVAIEVSQHLPAMNVAQGATVVGEGAEPAAVASAAVGSASGLRHLAPRRTAEMAVQRTFAERFGLHEPIYFIYGNEPQGAKYQFSFKYRLLGSAAALGEHSTVLRRLAFGYTQRSLWDIDSFSSPFYDSSYMPELFYESLLVFDEGLRPGWLAGYQVGLKHESNGRAGLDSRSLNIVYLRPVLTLGDFGRWHLVFAPRFYTYVSDLSDNPDINRYRGYAELQLMLQHGGGVALSASGRLGRSGNRGSVQLDLTFPVSMSRFFDFAAYFQVQYWSGYGESLLDYNKHSDALRFGFSLLR